MIYLTRKAIDNLNVTTSQIKVPYIMINVLISWLIESNDRTDKKKQRAALQLKKVKLNTQEIRDRFIA